MQDNTNNLFPYSNSLADQTSQPVTIYYSYTREDQKWLDKLEQHLAILRQLGRIVTWHDGLLEAGSLTDRQKTQKWEEAQLIILLISPAYFNTCYTQMEAALSRRKADTAHIIPVLVRPTPHWEQTPLGNYTFLPANGLAITAWSNRDGAFKQVADAIWSLVEHILRRQKHIHTPSRLLRDIPPLHLHDTILQRDVLVKQIASRLLQPDISLLMLTGMAGIGKSQFASQLYHYIEQQRQVGIGHFIHKGIWLFIRPTTTATELIAALCTELSPSPRDYQHLSPQELALEFVDLLGDDRHCRLIILDNFEAWLDTQGNLLTKAQGVEEWLPLLNERPCASRLLITSRIKPRTKHFHRQMYIQEMPLTGFSQEEGVALLQLWQMQGSKHDLERAITICKGHALALVLLADILQTYHISLKTLLNDLAYQRLFAKDIEHKLFDDIYTRYNEQQQLLLLAFSTYREAVLSAAVHAIARHVASMTEEQTLQSIGFLLTQGLLIALPGNEELYELHPLVAEFARARLSGADHPSTSREKEQFHSAAACYYQKASPTQWQRVCADDVHPLIEAAWHYCQAKQWEQGYTLIKQEHLFADLLRWGEYAILLELYTPLLSFHTWQREETRAQILHEMGEIYNGLGQKKKALSCFEEALSLYRKVGSSLEIARALNNAGSLYRIQRQVDRAFAYYNEALHIETLEDVEKGITLNNLGHAYQDLAMREQIPHLRSEVYSQALFYYEKAFVIHQALGERDEIGRTLNNMGEVYAGLEKWEQAQKHYIQALEQFRATLERRSEGIVNNNLGTLHRKRDEMEAAFIYYVQSLRIFRDIGARWEEAITLRNFGRLYVLLPRMDVALAFFLLANNIFDALRSPEQARIPRSLQIVLAGDQSFKQAVARIRPCMHQLVDHAIESEWKI